MIKGQKVKENNMSNYVISCCSTADLTREHMLERNIKYACFHYELDGKEYMDKLADLRDSGMDIDTLANWTMEHRLEVNHWFFSSDLTFFIRGGRISKTAGFVGNVLNICPFMNVSNEGKLIVREKIRTKKKAIKEMLVKMQALCKDGADYSDKVYISNSACYEDARAVADLIEAAFPKMKGKVEINDIGTTIGSHTGPGTVALFFWGNKRED